MVDRWLGYCIIGAISLWWRARSVAVTLCRYRLVAVIFCRREHNFFFNARNGTDGKKNGAARYVVERS